MTDPYRTDWMAEYRMGLGMGKPSNMHAKLPTEDLPEPLQKSAEAAQNAQTQDEAEAAAKEFLLLSEEYVDSGRRKPTETSEQ